MKACSNKQTVWKSEEFYTSMHEVQKKKKEGKKAYSGD